MNRGLWMLCAMMAIIDMVYAEQAKIDYDPLTYLPWKWTVARHTSSPQQKGCPSTASTLGTFAIVNVLVTLLGVLTGNRYFVHAITCGLLGKQRSGGRNLYLWIIPVGLNLSANVVNAYLIRKTPGYGDDFTLGELMLLYVARPRLGWILLVILSWVRQSHSYPWEDSAMSQVLGEAVLNIISLGVTGVTVHFARTQGYYPFDHKGLPKGASLMYAGALLHVISVALVLLPLAILCSLLLFQRLTESISDDDSSSNDGSHPYIVFTQIVKTVIAIGCIPTVWLGTWLFWAGYVTLVGDLYCPPNLATQAAVWTSGSVVGVLFGSAI